MGNVLLGNLGSCHPCGCYSDTYHLPKHCCRPCTPFHCCGLFQQDNLLCHKANMVQEWFEEQTSLSLTCPPNFPDLNPIEHLWNVLDKQVQSMEAPSRNLQDLKDLLRTSWCQIPQHTFRALVESMPQWVRAVLAAKGGPTQY